MFAIVIGILGIIVSALYVGYLAYAIGAVPLWVIVVGTYVLVIREFVVDFIKTGNRENNGGRST